MKAAVLIYSRVASLNPDKLPLNEEINVNFNKLNLIDV